MGEESHGHAASCRWWLDKQTTQPHHSQWLQATLFDLDEKIMKMVNLMEEDGDSFAKRAETYYNSRTELIKTIKDLHKTYLSIAEKYDQLHYESVSSSHKNLQIRKLKSLENTKIGASVFDSEYDGLNTEQVNDVENLEKVGNKCNEISAEMWGVIDENKKLQCEFMRRNEEKRKVIKALYEKVDKLMEENQLLKDKLAQCKADMDQNQSHLSKLKKMITMKLLN